MAYSFLAPTTACNAPSAAKRRADAQNAQVVALARLPRACCWAGRHEGYHTVAVQKPQAKLQEVGCRQPVHRQLPVHGGRCGTATTCRDMAHGTRHAQRGHDTPQCTGVALERYMSSHGARRQPHSAPMQHCAVVCDGRVSGCVQPLHERRAGGDAGGFRIRLRLPREAAAIPSPAPGSGPHA